MISVIIPTYRRYGMLREAVQSVLNQTYQDLEIIVIDDCSGDDTAKIVEMSPKIRYLCNEKNSGPGYSRLQGLLRSRGEHVVFLDDDDYYTDYSFYRNAVERLESNPDYSFVAANAVIIYGESGKEEHSLLNVRGEMPAAGYLEGFPFRNKKPHSTFTAVFRKSALLAAEVDKMTMVNDMPIYMRCLTAGGKVFFLEEEIGVYRMHGSNISKAMTPEFIIDNLKEKAEVLSRIKQAELFAGYNTWWFEQVKVTLDYYVYGSQPGFGAYWRVRNWCINFSEEKRPIRQLCRQYTAYLIDCRVCAIKRGIKYLLKITK